MSERVLVLGGVAFARQLSDDGVEVTLVDRNRLQPVQAAAPPGSQLPAAPEDIARLSPTPMTSRSS